MAVVLRALLLMCGNDVICEIRVEHCMAPYTTSMVSEPSADLKSKIFGFCFEHAVNKKTPCLDK